MASLCYHNCVIPRDLQPLFWDINTDTFEPEAYPQYTIARILEYGDLPAVQWLREHFTEEMIKAVIRAERKLSPKSANFWALVYDIPSDEVGAFQ